MRYVAIVASLAGTLVFGLLALFGARYAEAFIFLFVLCAVVSAIGVWDILQTKHSLRRNYPILANIRFGLEKIRPEIRQYFLESDTDATPYNRSKRAVTYQRLSRAPFEQSFHQPVSVAYTSYSSTYSDRAPGRTTRCAEVVATGGAQATPAAIFWGLTSPFRRSAAVDVETSRRSANAPPTLTAFDKQP